MSERSLREQIARELDPNCASAVSKLQGRELSPGSFDATLAPYWDKKWSEALAKADRILALLDAARAEGGASVDHIPDAGKMVGGDVEELVERLEPVAWRYHWTGDGRPVRWTLTQRRMVSQPAQPGVCALVAEPLYSADALLSLSRLLQERTRERDDLDRLGRLATNDATAAEARAETAERLLAKSERALRELHAEDGNAILGMKLAGEALEALSKVSEEGFSASQGCRDDLCADRSGLTAAAVSPEGEA